MLTAMKTILGRFRSGYSLALLFVLFIAGFNFPIRAQVRPDGPTVMAFFNAITMNDTNTAAQLLESHTNLVYAVENISKLPLLEAAAAGNLQLVKRLLELGADINAQGDTMSSGGSQKTALHAAIERNHPEVLLALLQAGADPNRTAFGFMTPLHLAFKEGHEDMASLLLDYGAEPFQGKLFSNDQTTPFEMAIQRGNGRLVARMLGQDRQHPLGAKSLPKPSHSQRSRRGLKTSAEVLSQHGNELLLSAAQRGELEAIESLLQAGVSAQSGNTNGPTILQAFSLAAIGAIRNHSATLTQWHQIQDRLKADYITKANPSYGSSLRRQEASLAAQVEATKPEHWQKILKLLTRHGASYDAFAATALNDTNQTQRLVAADKNAAQVRDGRGQTPLHWAINTDQPAMISFWIAAGTPLATQDDAGQTALHLAAVAGKVELVKVLLAAQAPTHIKDTNGWTPLDAAIQAKQADCIHWLLPDKTAPAHPERGLAITLHEAAATGNITALAALLETQTNLEARNELGLTPLQLAVTKGHLAAAALLVDKGADLNVRDPEGNSLLHQIFQMQFVVNDRPPSNWVAQLKASPHQELYVNYLMVGQYAQAPNPLLQGTSFLLACGLEAKTTNHAGQTVLQWMTDDNIGRGNFFFDEDREKLIQLLGRSGVDLEQRDAAGNTALHRLCTGFYDMTKVDQMDSLLASGAKVNATNFLGQTPLHVASKKIGGWDGNDPPVNEPFQLLIYRKADVNAQDGEGQTPLHVVALSDSSFKREAMQLLIITGANPNRQDHQGMTPLQLVAKSGNAFSESTVQFLLGAGANPNLKEKHGRTAAHFFLMGSWPWSSASGGLAELAAAKADFSIKDEDGKTPLHYLAGLGDQKPLFFIRGIDQILVDAKVDFQARDNDGNTPAIIAAKTQTQDVLDWLVKQGVDLDATNNLGETARLLMAHQNKPFSRPGPANAETDILQAAREGNVGAAERLLKADSTLVNQTNQFQQTPLRVAVMQHQTNMVGFLESHGAKWDEGTAVLAGRADILQTILKQNPAAVATKALGKRLLHLAAVNGDVESVKILIAAKADLQAKDNRGLSPLGYALIKKHGEVEALLRQHGARENLFDAVFINDVKTVAALLEQDPTLAAATDGERVSAVDIAAAAGHAEILKLLLKYDSSLSSAAPANHRPNPVHLAAFYDQPESLALLIRAGAKVNQADSRGFAPLHWVAIRGATNAAAWLLKHKADVNQAVARVGPGRNLMMMGPDGGTIAGATPLHLAALSGEINMVQLLIKSGADVNAVNERQQTPLDLVDGRPMMNPFGIGILQHGMLGLLEPLSVIPRPNAPLPAIRDGKAAASDLIRAAGGKHSQNRTAWGN